MRIVKKWLLSILSLLCASSILRARLFSLFGAHVGRGSKIEQVLLVHFEGDNLQNLSVGERVYIGVGTILDLKDRITIGDSVKIAAGCNLSTHVDCGTENPVSRLYPQRTDKITIGRGCWIGLGTTILCGTTIGNDCIVGAASLVNRDVPPCCIALGIPAKVTRRLTDDELFGSAAKTMSEAT